MKIEPLTLQEFVHWSLLGLVCLGLLGVISRALSKADSERRRRKLRRRCSQCRLLEEIEAGESKYGVCSVCGGVTSRGRTRKLG